MPRGPAPEPVLSEVVRQRLAALLDEVPARRAIVLPEPEDETALGDPASAPTSPGSHSVVPAKAGISSDEPPPSGPEHRHLLAMGVRTAWEFTRNHLAAVGMVLLAGCLWAGYNVLQARSVPVEKPVVTAPTVVASPEPSPTARILVHVLGAVRRPGVVELVEGARVRDAIAAAGGLTADADPGELNLAAVVSDGTQLVIGDSTEPRGELRNEAGGGSGGGSGDGQKISLNSATQAELETLPGVGPVTAARIVAWREQHGNFSRIEELQEIDGIGPKTYAQLADLVRL